MSLGSPPTAPARLGEKTPHRRSPHLSALGMSSSARLGAALAMIAGLWAVVGWALDWFS